MDQAALKHQKVLRPKRVGDTESGVHRVNRLLSQCSRADRDGQQEKNSAD